MIGQLIGLIITLIIVGVVWWAIQQLLPLLPLPAPVVTVINVLLVLILVVVVIGVLMNLFGVAGHLPATLRW